MSTPTVAPLDTGPRRLDDDVFQTAEEAVLVEGQGNGAAMPRPLSGQAFTSARNGARTRSSFTQAVGAHVAARPCQSALLAAAAGALAMLVLRSRLRDRIPTLRPFRLK
jgi:hypothetical protein